MVCKANSSKNNQHCVMLQSCVKPSMFKKLIIKIIQIFVEAVPTEI